MIRILLHSSPLLHFQVLFLSWIIRFKCDKQTKGSCFVLHCMAASLPWDVMISSTQNISGCSICSSTCPSRGPSQWVSQLRERTPVVKHLSYHSRKEWNFLLHNILPIILSNASINHQARTLGDLLSYEIWLSSMWPLNHWEWSNWCQSSLCLQWDYKKITNHNHDILIVELLVFWILNYRTVFISLPK